MIGDQVNGTASDAQLGTEQKPPFGRFWASAVAVGVIAFLFTFWAAKSDMAAGGLICFGALAKVISAVIGATIKTGGLEDQKPWIEGQLGYFDAAAGLTAFPALFAVGAELVLGNI